MTTRATVFAENERLVISGPLNFVTALSVWKGSLPLLEKYTQICIDLNHVVAENSGGLALILEWIKYAKRTKKTIKFMNVPPQLQSIAEVAGIDFLLSSNR